jgi:hypothetical protein
VFVSVVVVLGTEPVLVVRSEAGSCTSGEGAWVMMAGMGDATAQRLQAGPARALSLLQSEGRATERRVVVAGVSVGGSVVVGVLSAMDAAWWSGTTAQLWTRGRLSTSCVSDGLRELLATLSGMLGVELLYWGCSSVHSSHALWLSVWTWDAVVAEGQCVGHCTLRLGGKSPSSVVLPCSLTCWLFGELLYGEP